MPAVRCMLFSDRQFEDSYHMRKHTGEKHYPCTECDAKFSHNSNQKRPIKRIHRGETPYQCQLCDKAFSQAYDMKEHVRIHTKDGPYTCTECDAAFSHDGYQRGL